MNKQKIDLMSDTEKLNDISKKLSLLNEQIEKLSRTIIEIDSSITGDKKRGLNGIVDHIDALNESFRVHSHNDETRFSDLFDSQKKIEQKFEKMSGWIAGAVAVCVSITPVLTWFINKIAQ